MLLKTKILILILICFCINQKIKSQVFGFYHDIALCGETIFLNYDSTFQYECTIDTWHSKGSGKYELKNDTLFLSYEKYNNEPFISLSDSGYIDKGKTRDKVGRTELYLVKDSKLYKLDKNRKIIKRVRNGFIFKKVFFIIKKRKFKYYFVKYNTSP